MVGLNLELTSLEYTKLQEISEKMDYSLNDSVVFLITEFHNILIEEGYM